MKQTAQQIDWKRMNREERGKLIFQSGRIKKQNDFWIVGSQTSFRTYKVKLKGYKGSATYEKYLDVLVKMGLIEVVPAVYKSGRFLRARTTVKGYKLKTLEKK